MPDTATALIVACIGALSGLLPVAVTLIVQWTERRTYVAQRRQVIDLAHRHVEFLSLWLKTRQLSCPPEQFSSVAAGVVEELEKLRRNVTVAAQEIREPQPSVRETAQEKRHWLQSLFLAYFPRSASGWVFHLLFYMGLGFSVFLALVFVGVLISTDSLEFVVPQYVVAMQMGGIVGVLLAASFVLFWVPATMIEKRASRGPTNATEQTKSK